MNLKKITASALLAFGFSVLGVVGADATTFLEYHPVDTATNINLTGLTLSSSSEVSVSFLVPGLSDFGDLSATYTLSALETGAVAFGPLALGTFDGTFALTYDGPNVTIGTVTIHTGDDLLSGTFLGSVFTGYGSAGTLLDSILGGGLVSFNNNDFLTFDPLGDQALALAFTSLSPAVHVVNGQLTDFDAVSSGNYAADILTNCAIDDCHVNNVPEPITLSLFGAGLAGAAALRRRKQKSV